MKLKYIKYDNDKFILFPTTQSHKDMAEIIGGKIDSAGFVSIRESNVDVFGESESLGIESAEGDEDLLIAFTN